MARRTFRRHHAPRRLSTNSLLLANLNDSNAKKTSKKLIAARKRVSKAETALKKAKNRAKRLVASRKTADGKAKARKTSKKSVVFFEKRLAKAKAAAKKLQAPPRNAKRSPERPRRPTTSGARTKKPKTSRRRRHLTWAEAWKEAAQPGHARARAREYARRERAAEKDYWTKGIWPAHWDPNWTD